MKIALLLLALISADEIDALVERLGSDGFAAREAAGEKLADLLRKDPSRKARLLAIARETSDPEVRMRIHSALVHVEWAETPPPGVPERRYFAWVTDGERAVLWGGNDGESRRTDGAVHERGVWHALPAAPIAPRVSATVRIVGDRLVVWSGGGRGGYQADGALYDLKAGTVKKIPDAPIVGRSDPAVVDLGGKLLLWGGVVSPNRLAQSEGPVQIMYQEPSFPGDGAVLDLGTLAWTPVAAAPIEGRRCEPLWTGERLVVVGGSREKGMMERTHPRDGAVYDPATDSWEALPECPLEAVSRVVATEGGGWIAWGSRGFAFDGRAWKPLPLAASTAAFLGVEEGRLLLFGREHGLRGAVLDLAAGKWTDLPDAPLAPRIYPEVWWDGASLLVWGGHAVKEPRYDFFADGATWKVGEERWRPIAPSPLDVDGRMFRKSTHDGRHLVVWGGSEWVGQKGGPEGLREVHHDDAAIYDRVRDEWRMVPSTGPLSPWLREPRFAWVDGRLLIVAQDASRAVTWTPPE